MSITASVVNLLSDILSLIYDQLPLSSHFDSACTYKRLAVASQDVLRRRQEAHAKFSVMSDLEPIPVSLLLKSAFGADRISAWHVRSFKIWRDQTSCNEWKTYSLYTPVDFDFDKLVSDLQILTFQPLLERVGEYLDWYEGYSHGDINEEKAIAQIERGHDGLLKAPIFAQLPPLRYLKFVTHSQATCSTLSWLRTLIRVSKTVHPEPEPTHHDEEEGACAHYQTAEEHRSMTETLEHSERLLQSKDEALLEITYVASKRRTPNYTKKSENYLDNHVIIHS